MFPEIADDLAISLDGLANQFGVGVLVVTVAESGTEALDIEIARVEQKTHD